MRNTRGEKRPWRATRRLGLLQAPGLAHAPTAAVQAEAPTVPAHMLPHRTPAQLLAIARQGLAEAAHTRPGRPALCGGPPGGPARGRRGARRPGPPGRTHPAQPADQRLVAARAGGARVRRLGRLLRPRCRQARGRRGRHPAGGEPARGRRPAARGRAVRHRRRVHAGPYLSAAPGAPDRIRGSSGKDGNTERGNDGGTHDQRCGRPCRAGAGGWRNRGTGRAPGASGGARAEWPAARSRAAPGEHGRGGYRPGGAGRRGHLADAGVAGRGVAVRVLVRGGGSAGPGRARGRRERHRPGPARVGAQPGAGVAHRRGRPDRRCGRGGHGGAGGGVRAGRGPPGRAGPAARVRARAVRAVGGRRRDVAGHRRALGGARRRAVAGCAGAR